MSHISHKSNEDKRIHYPHLFAPPSLHTANLPSYRPERYLNPVLWTCATLGNKEKEQQLREYMWRTEQPCNPSRTLTPDSVTDYTYDYDNRLTTVSLPTNSDTVEYTYDAMGRRLTKKYTYHNGANTDVTTYKYHYIGGQITEIEIDAIRNPGEGQSVLRNEEVKIHLGANSQPISYEWVKHVGESTTSATYYYHYDIHGNVLKVTDSSENVKITYTYDVLGKILTESNPDNIINFFTFRGASQTIWDSEVGMYYSGGYYRPDTGTALQGTGAPVLTNPASGAMLNAVAQATSTNAQLAVHAMISASSAGSAGGGSPGNFAPPSGPSDGVAHSGKASPPPMPKPSQEPDPGIIQPDIPTLGMPRAWIGFSVSTNPDTKIGDRVIPGGIVVETKYYADGGEVTKTQYNNIMAGRDKDWSWWDELSSYEKELLLNTIGKNEAKGEKGETYTIDPETGTVTIKDKDGKVTRTIDVKNNLIACAFAYGKDEKGNYVGKVIFYHLKGQEPVFFSPEGQRIKPTDYAGGFVQNWEYWVANGKGNFKSVNTTDVNLYYLYCGATDVSKDEKHMMKIFVAPGVHYSRVYSANDYFHMQHADMLEGDNNLFYKHGSDKKVLEPGRCLVVFGDGNFVIYENGDVKMSGQLDTDGKLFKFFTNYYNPKGLSQNIYLEDELERGRP